MMRPARRNWDPATSRSLLGALLLLSGALPGQAQTTVSAEVGLGGYFRGTEWMPVRVQLTNQGEPARVEVTVRQSTGQTSMGTSTLPEQTLPPAARAVHTLYLRPRTTYTSSPVAVELRKGGRVLNTVTQQPELVPHGNWLVAGVGAGAEGLNILTTVVLSAKQARRDTDATNPRRTYGIKVATLTPERLPDRWQGLAAADMVVLGRLSERELSPEQATALGQYVAAGGILVITGGVDWQRLDTPFFRQLLPGVAVGAGSRRGLPAGYPGLGIASGRNIPYTILRPAQGAEVIHSAAGHPWLVRKRLGTGRVFFVAWDALSPEFTSAGQSLVFWRSLLQPGGAILTEELSSHEDGSASWRSGQTNWTQLSSHLALAPYAISLMDVPAFYLVALFLLAYVVILVPVNYYVLKALDKREFAWISTPIIVALFSAGAYAIGFGTRGGRSMVVRTGIVETFEGQATGRYLGYLGLFSPKKGSYTLAPVEDASRSTLLALPATDREGSPAVLRHRADVELTGFAVDMWAMRVFRQDSLYPLGRGVTATISARSGKWDIAVRNNTPYAIRDAAVISDGRVWLLDPLPAGGESRKTGAEPAIEGSGILPGSLADRLRGNSDDIRVRKSVLSSLTEVASNLVKRTQGEFVLVGWLEQNGTPVSIDGRRPKESSADLLLVHLEKH